MLPLKDLLFQYQQSHQALPAFNLDSFEIYQAVELAVADTRLPCLVQISKAEDKFIQAERLFMLVKKSQADGLPIYLNFDHGSDPARLHHLINLGFDMIHFDGSTLDIVANVATLRPLVDYAHTHHCLVEAEFNHIELVEYGVSPQSFTTPDSAHDFILKSDADLLAVSIGNMHGVNAARPEQLDLKLLSEINQSLPASKFLTLHGGSGIAVDQIREAIKLGIVKININTDLRLKFKQSLLSSLASTDSVKVYDYLTPVVSDLANLIKQKLLSFSAL